MTSFPMQHLQHLRNLLRLLTDLRIKDIFNALRQDFGSASLYAINECHLLQACLKTEAPSH